jgi:DNA-binding NtrC family response regulator
VAVDVRVVSATHRELREDVNAERFRLDLYYRLAVVTLAVPPLRERREDIPLLVAKLAAEAGETARVDELLSERALEMLGAHRWPGNVRELRNWVEAALAMEEAPELVASAPKGGGPAAIDATLLELTYKEARQALLGEFEGRYLARLLERANGNVSEAARLARMDRSHLNDLLRRHGLR